MISYALWSEAGGVGKTALAVNLAAAHRRHGQKTLLVDLDPQNGGASHHLGVDDERADPDVDNLVRHLIDRPKGEFSDLVRETTHGLHVIPSHNMLDSLETNLQRAQEMEQDMGGRFVKELQLRRVIGDSGVPDEYDVVVVDPPATGGQHVYNAVAATGNVVIPLELSPKGEQSLYGLEDTVSNLEAEVDTEVGVVAVVPNKVRRTRMRDKYEAALNELDYPVSPVKIPVREAMLNGAWDAQTTAFEFVSNNKRAEREHDTLRAFDELARFVAGQYGVELTEDDLTDDEREVVV
ncbi:ParA family protein [Halopelagius longus]|uniref:Chromosome partitioning protein n=1 Tax=Halopelagius longus TaxID=1236180 RepID=A0A1H1G8Q5_9EURY|nr:ParA family protein [Halopelagius longus]RDI69788.1 ParA family protein [Halopelagius longus]SDR09288.1 chromosome partitioning protein [Halopelagius longus]